MQIALLPEVEVFRDRLRRTKAGKGKCVLERCDSERVSSLVKRLQLGGFRFNCAIANGNFGSAPSLDDDCSYRLRIEDSLIQLKSQSEWGAIAGCSTLAQLSAAGELPDCNIEDKPMHPWRGLLVDVSRHFMELTTLRSIVQLMHLFKLNALHLHLTDDQAFRFGSDVFPNLASEQHYTKSELQSLVEFASDHGVRVVPEIDIPGHTTSWLVAHPEWGCESVDLADTLRYGVHEACLDPSNPEAMQSVFSILQEVIETFPDRFLHIGGDEVNPAWWDRSDSVKGWARERGLNSARDIQAFFTNQVVDFLLSRERTTVVWDEALHETLDPSVVVQAWRGMRARDCALTAGHKTLLSSPYYLDLNYPAHVHYGYWPTMGEEEWKKQDAACLELAVFDHVKDGLRWHQEFGEFPDLPARPGGEILGGEACMWSELATDELVLRRIWTRLPAIAERLWSSPDDKSTDDLYRRLNASLNRLAHLDLPSVYSDPPIHECTELVPLFEMLEPVKWYARMLTTDGVEDRAHGDPVDPDNRPYNGTSPLNKVVDQLPPESLEVRKCIEDVKSGRDLSRWIRGWRLQADVFESACSQHPDLVELAQVSDALSRLADVAAGTATPDPQLAGPFGEYMLPVAFAFGLENDSG